LGRLASLPLWVRLVILTAAGLISLVGSSLFLSSALHQTADRTTKMKQLFDVARVAGEAHVSFGELRYWLTDLSVSQLVISERNADSAREKLELHLDRLLSYDPDTVASIRKEVEAYFSRAMDAADAYTDGNRVIGNTLLGAARAHSGKVDEALDALVGKVNAVAIAERLIVVEHADESARTALYIVIVLSVLGLGLTVMVLRSIVQPLQRLNDAITSLMQGRYDVDIPTEEGHEFGAMARTLHLFREHAIERERLEIEAERHKQRLVQAEKMANLGQLTAGIAHEIKNPLNFVNNFAKLSDDEPQSVSLNAIVEEALNLVYHGKRAEHPGFNIEMVKSLAPEVGEIECFPQDLMRVFLNLIANGMYAAHERSTLDETGDDFAPTIWLTTRTKGNKVEVEVRDNGVGIAAEVRDKIFMPFFTTKPAGEGTGLGLSLSYDIVVKEHSGEIEVDSQAGEFTAFRVTLPRVLATSATEPSSADAEESRLAYDKVNNR
jgi:signal transduction histidine kinase